MTTKIPATDSGNAQRLVQYSGAKFRYVDKWKRFVVWNGKHWAEDKGKVRMLALTKEVVIQIRREAAQETNKKRKGELWDWYRQSQSERSRAAVVSLAKGEIDAQAQPDEFDCSPYLLTLANGTLDLKTGELGPHSAKHRLTRMSPVRYSKTAKCPLWDNFLERILPDPSVRAFVQRYAGYCLTGDVSARLIAIFYGSGRNGKSVMLRVLQKLLGPYAIAANPELLITRGADAHPTELADLFGVRLAVTSEVKKGRQWDEEKVKRLTGNDVIRARRMQQDFWEFEPTAKLIAACNHTPRVQDATDSFWDRIALIPFTVRIPEEVVDLQLLTKLMKEMPGILNWAVKGCLAFQKEGLWMPEAVKIAKATYRADEDLIGIFLQDCLSFNPLATVTSDQVTAVLQEWCQKNGLRPFGPKAWGMRLREAGAVPYRTNTGRGWTGVGLKPKEKEAVRVPEKKKVAPAWVKG